VPAEDEDILVKVLPFTEAYAMVERNEVDNAVAIEDPDTHIRHMNDFATFEIFWHWLWTLHRHGRMSLAVFERLLVGEAERVRKAYFGDSAADYAASKWPSVFHIVKRLVVHPTMLPYGSHVLLAVVDEADEAKRKAISWLSSSIGIFPRDDSGSNAASRNRSSSRMIRSCCRSE